MPISWEAPTAPVSVLQREEGCECVDFYINIFLSSPWGAVLDEKTFLILEDREQLNDMLPAQSRHCDPRQVE